MRFGGILKRIEWMPGDGSIVLGPISVQKCENPDRPSDEQKRYCKK